MAGASQPPAGKISAISAISAGHKKMWLWVRSYSPQERISAISFISVGP